MSIPLLYNILSRLSTFGKNLSFLDVKICADLSSQSDVLVIKSSIGFKHFHTKSQCKQATHMVLLKTMFFRLSTL